MQTSRDQDALDVASAKVTCSVSGTTIEVGADRPDGRPNFPNRTKVDLLVSAAEGSFDCAHIIRVELR
jgi:hypothetical protein